VSSEEGRHGLTTETWRIQRGHGGDIIGARVGKPGVEALHVFRRGKERAARGGERGSVDARCRIELLGGLRVRQGEREITRFCARKRGALLERLVRHLPHQNCARFPGDARFRPIPASASPASGSIGRRPSAIAPPGRVRLAGPGRAAPRRAVAPRPGVHSPLLTYPGRPGTVPRRTRSPRDRSLQPGSRPQILSWRPSQPGSRPAVGVKVSVKTDRWTRFTP
jgi:hypothetical protein